MAMRVNHGVEPIKSPPGIDRDGSRPKPPKAVAQRATFAPPRRLHEDPRSCSDQGHSRRGRRDAHFAGSGAVGDAVVSGFTLPRRQPTSVGLYGLPCIRESRPSK